MINKFGKPMGNILKSKETFFIENDKHLQRNNAVRDVYMRQGRRVVCVVCSSPLLESHYITSHGLRYFMCEVCRHVNGEFRVDGSFYEQYSEIGYTEIYKSPSLDEYRERMIAIYTPKAQFLVDALEECGVPYENYSFLDVGAGSGYFVGALKDLGLNASGIEISQPQVSYGNIMLGAELLKAVPPDKIVDEISSTNCQVVSIIGVLTGIEDMHSFFNAIKQNSNIQFVFFNVQMFSLSCIIESVFPEVYNRQLGGTLTHLFSRSSLEWLCSHYSLNPLAEWCFGTDIMDLYRSFWVMAGQSSKLLQADIANYFVENADALQLVVDKSLFGGESTLLVEVSR